jgi:hypothetical protein
MIAFMGPIIAELIHKGLANKPSAPEGLVNWVAGLDERVARPLLDGMGLEAGFTFTAVVLFIAGCIALLLPGELVRRVARD